MKILSRILYLYSLAVSGLTVAIVATYDAPVALCLVGLMIAAIAIIGGVAAEYFEGKFNVSE